MIDCYCTHISTETAIYVGKNWYCFSLNNTFVSFDPSHNEKTSQVYVISLFLVLYLRYFEKKAYLIYNN